MDHGVQPLGVVDVTHHNLGVLQGRLAEANLQQLERLELFGALKVDLVDQLFGQHRPIRRQEEFLGPVDVGQEGDGVGVGRRPPTAAALGRLPSDTRNLQGCRRPRSNARKRRRVALVKLVEPRHRRPAGRRPKERSRPRRHGPTIIPDRRMDPSTNRSTSHVVVQPTAQRHHPAAILVVVLCQQQDDVLDRVLPRPQVPLDRLADTLQDIPTRVDILQHLDRRHVMLDDVRRRRPRVQQPRHDRPGKLLDQHAVLPRTLDAHLQILQRRQTVWVVDDQVEQTGDALLLHDLVDRQRQRRLRGARARARDIRRDALLRPRLLLRVPQARSHVRRQPVLHVGQHVPQDPSRLLPRLLTHLTPRR